MDRRVRITKYYSYTETAIWQSLDKIQNSYASQLTRVFNSIIRISTEYFKRLVLFEVCTQ